VWQISQKLIEIRDYLLPKLFSGALAVEAMTNCAGQIKE